jgi:hypothetical protein
MKIYFPIILLSLHSNLFAQQANEAKMIQINEFNIQKTDIDLNLGFNAVICYKNKLPNTYTRFNFGLARYKRQNKLYDDLSNITYYHTNYQKTNAYSIGFGQEYRQSISPNFYAVVGADVCINLITLSYKSLNYQRDSVTNNFVVIDANSDSYIASIIKASPYIGIRFVKNRFVVGADITASLSYSSYFSSTPQVMYSTNNANFRLTAGYKMWK